LYKNIFIGLCKPLNVTRGCDPGCHISMMTPNELRNLNLKKVEKVKMKWKNSGMVSIASIDIFFSTFALKDFSCQLIVKS